MRTAENASTGLLDKDWCFIYLFIYIYGQNSSISISVNAPELAMG